MKLKEIEPQRILYLRGVVNYTEFYFKDGKKFVSSFTLKHHQESLSHFLRVSKSHLLNPSSIKRIHYYGSEREVELNTGKRVKVSRRRRIVLESINISKKTES